MSIHVFLISYGTKREELLAKDIWLMGRKPKTYIFREPTPVLAPKGAAFGVPPLNLFFSTPAARFACLQILLNFGRPEAVAMEFFYASSTNPVVCEDVSVLMKI
jgi:hypothetical protein